MDERIIEILIALLIGAIIVVFIGNFVLTALDSHWTPDTTIGPITGTLAGGLFAWLLAKQNKKQNGNGD